MAPASRVSAGLFAFDRKPTVPGESDRSSALIGRLIDVCVCGETSACFFLVVKDDIRWLYVFSPGLDLEDTRTQAPIVDAQACQWCERLWSWRRSSQASSLLRSPPTSRSVIDMSQSLGGTFLHRSLRSFKMTQKIVSLPPSMSDIIFLMFPSENRHSFA